MKPNKKWNPNQTFFSNLAVVLIGITFYLCASHLNIVREQLSKFMSILAPFVWAFVMAYLLDGPVRYFEKKLKMKRGVAICCTYLLAILIISVLLSFVLPQLLQSVMILVDNVGSYLSGLNTFTEDIAQHFNLDEEVLEGMLLSYQELVQRATSLIRDLLPQVLNYSIALGNGLISGITSIIASIYMLSGKKRLLHQMNKIVYAFLPLQRAHRFHAVCSHANRVFTGFINGKLLDSAIIGVICFVCTTLFKMPFALLVSVIIGVTNIIPFFGPFIGAIPSVMILLMVDPIKALWFCLFIIVLQQFDGNILGPKILGDSTGLSAIWVLVSIIVGGGLFGFVGMVVGVPAFAVLYSLTSEFLAARLRAKKIDAQGNPLVQPEPEEETPAPAPGEQ